MSYVCTTRGAQTKEPMSLSLSIRSLSRIQVPNSFWEYTGLTVK